MPAHEIIISKRKERYTNFKEECFALLLSLSKSDNVLVSLNLSAKKLYIVYLFNFLLL